MKLAQALLLLLIPVVSFSQLIERGDTISIEYEFEYKCSNRKCGVLYRNDMFDIEAGAELKIPLYYYHYSDFDNSGPCRGSVFIGYVECDSTPRIAKTNDSLLYSLTEGASVDLRFDEIDNLYFYYPGAGRSDIGSLVYYKLNRRSEGMWLSFFDCTGRLLHQQIFEDRNNIYRISYNEAFTGPPYPAYHSLQIILAGN